MPHWRSVRPFGQVALPNAFLFFCQFRIMPIYRIQIASLLPVLAILAGCTSKSPTPKPTENISNKAAKEVLSQMRTVYRNAKSYVDNSTVIASSVERTKGVENEFPYQDLSIAFERPNKLSILYSGAVEGLSEKTVYKIACNGEIVRSFANEVPLQIHETIAPETLTTENFLPEPALRADLLQVSLENILPQLAMLLTEDPEQPIFSNSSQHKLLREKELDGNTCYRVQSKSPEGNRVLWISKDDCILRRMEIPIDNQSDILDAEDRFLKFSIWIDFRNITLDSTMDASSFELTVPTGGRRVRRFIAPPPEVPENADTETLTEHRRLIAEYERAISAATIKDSILNIEFSRPQAGPEKLPKLWKLEQLWQTSSRVVSQPGNVLLVNNANQILVLDGGQSIVEFDIQGNLVDRHELPIHEVQKGGILRTSVDSQGQPWYLASGVGWQQVYLFDESWQNILTFPEKKHSGIGDVYLGDRAEKNNPTFLVGYWGGLGIQGGTFDGRRLWANRSMDHVLQITSGPPDIKGETTIWCTSTRGTILVLTAEGKTSHELYIEDQALMAVARNPKKDSHCGLAIKSSGWYSAVGFSEDGLKQWEYPLPPGEYATQAPRIQRADFPDGTLGWLLCAANGSLHWLDHEGHLVDRFDYDQLITGVAMGTVPDGTLLLISTDQHLTAWLVQL